MLSLQAEFNGCSTRGRTAGRQIGTTKCGVKFTDAEIDGDGRMEKEKPQERKKRNKEI